jgi:hypothetical protein
MFDNKLCAEVVRHKHANGSHAHHDKERGAINRLGTFERQCEKDQECKEPGRVEYGMLDARLPGV